VAIDAPGVDEETVVPWSLLLDRAARRRREAPPGDASPPMIGPGDPAIRPWLVTWVVLIGTFFVASTITILAVSRPLIAVDLDVSTESLVWLISGPTIAVALTSTTAGKLGDLHGHRRVYLIGMFGATVFVVLTALAWSGPSLIAFRVLGATIGAATGPSSLALINRMFPAEDRARALGFWSLVVAAGPVFGLVVGGPLVEAFGWRAIFWFQAPLLAVTAVWSFLALPETPRLAHVHFDVSGQAALAVAIAGLLIGIDRAVAWGLTNPWVLGCWLLVPTALLIFVRIERRVPHPLIPLDWFANPAFSVPVAIGFFVQFGYMGGFILAPKLLAEVRGLSADTVALMMIPRPLTFAIAGPLAGWSAARISARSTTVAGTLSLTLSLVVFALVADDPGTAVIVLALALSGAGIGAAQPRLTACVANSVPVGDLGIAGATQLLVAQVGTTLGMNVMESVEVVAVGVGGPGSSYSVAYVVGAALSACAVGLALLIKE
jgi:MFS family permease